MTTTPTTQRPRLVEATIMPRGKTGRPPASLRPSLRPVRTPQEPIMWVPRDGITTPAYEAWEAWVGDRGGSLVTLDFEDNLAEVFALAGAPGRELSEILLDPIGDGGRVYTTLGLTRLASAISGSRDELEEQGYDYNPFVRRALYQVFGKAFPAGVVCVAARPRIQPAG